jgi:mono/diheme cytochrome c family protein
VDGGGAARVLVAIAIATLVAGCGADDERTRQETRAVARAAAARERLLLTGNRVYVQHCDVCHRLFGERAARTPPPDSYGPSFDEIRPTYAFVKHRVELGVMGMQSFADVLTPYEIRAVARYVTTVAGRDVPPTRLDPATRALGERIFVARCQRCHTLGARRAREEHYPATDFADVQPASVYVVRMLDGTGNAFLRELMGPAGRGLSRRAMRAVAAYVSKLSGQLVGSPRGAGERR